MTHLTIKCGDETVTVNLPAHFTENLEIQQIETLEPSANTPQNQTYSRCLAQYTAIKLPQKNRQLLKLIDNGIFILINDYYRKILFSQIMWIEASRSYCCINIANRQQPIVVAFPLCQLARKLPADTFLRVHRSFILNLYFIDAFAGNMFFIGKKHFPISELYTPDLNSLLIVLSTLNRPSGKKQRPLGKN